ncbi:MAG: hypothetical protein ACRD08_11195, partial [Acidimicrobiales bacterium]
ALPKFANTKEKAYLASMKSDLRNLVTAEEAYFADSVKYVDPGSLPGYGWTTGVSLTATKGTGADGFWAEVQHTATTKMCGIYVGTAGTGKISYVATEGAPACK